MRKVVIPKGFIEKPVQQAQGIIDAVEATLTDSDLKNAGEITGRLQRLEDAGLLKFAADDDGVPAIFVAPDSDIPDATDRKLTEALIKYFDTKGTFSNTGEMVENGIRVSVLFERFPQLAARIREALYRHPSLTKASGREQISDADIVKALDALEARGGLRFMLDEKTNKIGVHVTEGVMNADPLDVTDLSSEDAAAYVLANKVLAEAVLDVFKASGGKGGPVVSPVLDVSLTDDEKAALEGVAAKFHMDRDRAIQEYAAFRQAHDGGGVWRSVASFEAHLAAQPINRMEYRIGPNAGDPVYKLEEKSYEDWTRKYPLAVRSIAEEAKVSRRVVEETILRWNREQWIRFVVVPDKKGVEEIFGVMPKGMPKLETRTEKEAMKGFRKMFDVGHPKVTVGDVPADANINVSQWLLESAIDATQIAKFARLDVETFAKTMYSLEERGFLWITRGVEPDGRRTYAVRLRVKDIESLSKEDKQIVEGLAKYSRTESFGKYKPGQLLQLEQPGEHTYMRAIEMQYRGLADLSKTAGVAASRGTQMFRDMSAAEMWGIDVAILKRATAFCWFEEPTFAVEAAAGPLPDSVRLTRDLTEGYCGWWYFLSPLPIRTLDYVSPDDSQRHVSEQVIALSWAWCVNAKTLDDGTNVQRNPGVRFTAWIWDDAMSDGGPVPTTVAYWNEGKTLAEALHEMKRQYSARYDPANQPDAYKWNPEFLNQNMTLEAMNRMFRFFAAGSLWIQQKILLMSKGHVERHLRKRIEREQKPDRPVSEVQLIQLRRVQYTTEQRKSAGGTVEWKNRWLVGAAKGGFWRSQYYPSKGTHQPKWIEVFVKGPADKPLKVPKVSVYAVNR